MIEKAFTINENKCSIHCVLRSIEKQAVKRVILCCHGFAGSKNSASVKKLAEKLLPSHKTAAVLSFDWPCHGEDRSPKLTLDGCALYLRTVTDYIRSRWGEAPIDVNAVSFGAYLTLRYLRECGDPFEKILLRSPAIPMHAVLTGTLMDSGGLQLLQKTKTALVGFDVKVRITAGFVEELAAYDLMQKDFSDYADKLCIVHGTKDEIVPFDAVNAFAEKNGIALLAVENADHRFMDPSLFSRTVDAAALHYGL